MTNPTGEQWTIRHDDQEATVVEVGGGLRTYRAGGRDVLAGYAADEPCRAGRGQLLMPWPNRIRDGKYTFEGTHHQLSLTEPERHNACHGLVRWARWDLSDLAEGTVTVTNRVHPQPGWDWPLDICVTYTLDDAGLTVRSTATNLADSAAPFGYGVHPYLAIGDASPSDVALRLPAEQELLVDDRLLPTDTVAVTQDHDFRAGRPLGGTSLDTAYTGLARDARTGRWEASVTGPDQRALVVWGDEAFGWLQVFTGMAAESGVEGARGIAVEPMTCPAEAFTSGQGLVVLAPGESWSGTWGITVTG